MGSREWRPETKSGLRDRIEVLEAELEEARTENRSLLEQLGNLGRHVTYLAAQVKRVHTQAWTMVERSFQMRGTTTEPLLREREAQAFETIRQLGHEDGLNMLVERHGLGPISTSVHGGRTMMQIVDEALRLYAEKKLKEVGNEH